MCLHPRPVDPVPEETARVARAAFPRGNAYMKMRDELGVVFEDEDFAGLFPRRGQPAMAPWRLALVTVVQFAETCDEGYPGLITHVETTAAPVPDGRVLAPVHEALEAKGMLPSTHIADSGYMGIEALLAARRDHDIELLDPVRENKHWQVREGKGFDLSNFEVDWERERVTCPEGKHSIRWSPTKDAYGRDIVDIRFSRADCGACPSLDSCIRYTPWDEQKGPKKKKQNPKRHLRVPARERYEALKGRPASASGASGIWPSTPGATA